MSPFRRFALVVSVASIAMPAGATSVATTNAFGRLCLDTNMDREAVSTVAEHMGMKVYPERVSQVSDSDDLNKILGELAGVPLTEMTVTGFLGFIPKEGLPAGIVDISLTMNEVGAADSDGRQVTISMCGVTSVTSTEEAGAARAFLDVRRALASQLPVEAIAGEPTTKSRGRITMDAMQWHWGNIDTDSGRVFVEYRGMTQQGSMGGSTLTVSRVMRALE